VVVAAGGTAALLAGSYVDDVASWKRGDK
jgi:hypothetical protein